MAPLSDYPLICIPTYRKDVGHLKNMGLDVCVLCWAEVVPFRPVFMEKTQNKAVYTPSQSRAVGQGQY